MYVTTRAARKCRQALTPGGNLFPDSFWRKQTATGHVTASSTVWAYPHVRTEYGACCINAWAHTDLYLFREASAGALTRAACSMA
jgi:hypothetical protein